jgi:hypothetical protein
MLFDTPPSDLQVAVAVGPGGWAQHLLVAGAAEDSDAAHAVMQHLLQSAASTVQHGERPTFARLIHRAATDPNGDDARRILEDHGLGVAPYPAPEHLAPGGPLHLFVANKHPRLAEVFAGTRWAGDRWREDFRRMAGACVPPNPRRECGPTKPRCTVVPAPQLGPVE